MQSLMAITLNMLKTAVKLCAETNLDADFLHFAFRVLKRMPNLKAQSRCRCRWLLGTSSAISIRLSRHLSVPAKTPPA